MRGFGLSPGSLLLTALGRPTLMHDDATLSATQVGPSQLAGGVGNRRCGEGWQSLKTHKTLPASTQAVSCFGMVWRATKEPRNQGLCTHST